MVNLDLLQNLLKNATQPKPTENGSEEHFDQIVTCIEKEKIHEAQVMIEKIFAKGIPDIRLIVYYFYAHFTNHGIKSFIKIFPGIISIINDHWDVLRPVDRKDKHVQNSLNWFFSNILLKLKYAEKLRNSGKMHPIWKKSVLEVTPEELQNLITIANEFKDFFVEKWPKSSTKERLLHLLKKIDDLKPLIIEEVKPPEPMKIEEPIVVEKIEQNVEIESFETQSIDENQLPFQPFSQEKTDPFYEHHQETEQLSEAMEEPPMQAEKKSSVNNFKLEGEALNLPLEKLEDFSRKLKIFELLVSQNNYLKAAVVAKDIDHLLENFDPLNYFPKMFAKYFSLFAKHVAALSEQYENKESLQVKALEKLYRADLEMFIDW